MKEKYEMKIEKRKLGRERERDEWYLLQLGVKSLKRANFLRLQNKSEHLCQHHQRECDKMLLVGKKLMLVLWSN